MGCLVVSDLFRLGYVQPPGQKERDRERNNYSQQEPGRLARQQQNRAGNQCQQIAQHCRYGDIGSLQIRDC